MVLFGKKLAEAKIWLKPNMETLQRTANRGSVSTGDGNSVKLEADNTEFFSRTPDSNSNRQTFTYSTWIKRTELGINGAILDAYQDGSNFFLLQFDTSDRFVVYQIDSGTDYGFHYTRRFRDIAAWYHIVFVSDTTNGTAADRYQLYVNGERISNSDVDTDYGTPPLNYNNNLNSTILHHIGKRGDGAIYNSCYLAETHLVDGTALAPTAFGEYDSASGIWKPIEVDVTHGTNGFYLDYADAADLGDDESGNGNDWAENNIAAADQAADIPTNSFCTLNPISYNVPYTSSEGNTKYVKSDGTYGMASGTHYVGAGKWYWEVKATDFGTYSACHFGILDAAKTTVSADERGYEDPSLAATNPEILVMSGAPNNWVMNSTATITNNGAMSSVDYTFNEGDILAIALDMDNGAFWFGNSRYSGVANGSFWVAPGGTSTSGSVATTDPSNGNYALVGDGGGTNNGTPNFNGGTITGGSLLTAGFTLVTPIIGAYHDSYTVTLEVNFGGFTSYAEDGGYADANGHGNFAYAVPSGFYSLCSKNIAEFGGSG